MSVKNLTRGYDEQFSMLIYCDYVREFGYCIWQDHDKSFWLMSDPGFEAKLHLVSKFAEKSHLRCCQNNETRPYVSVRKTAKVLEIR